jgi:hypothetical protein
MSKRLRLRKNQTGEVFLGSYEPNQPERIALSAATPFVDTALRKRGLTDEQIEAEMQKYDIYIPEFLFWAPVPGAVPVPVLELDIELPPEEESEAEESEAEMDEVSEPESLEDVVGDSEDLQVDEPEAPELPTQSAMAEMTRDELVRLAEQLGVESDIEGSGANGYVTVPDLRRFLIPHVKQLGN